MHLTRLRLAKLQAVLSKNRYSEQGFDARIRPPSGDVCHSFIVVSYWTPGSTHFEAASAILFQSSLALTLLITEPSVLAIRSHSPSSTALTNSAGTRTGC